MSIQRFQRALSIFHVVCLGLLIGLPGCGGNGESESSKRRISSNSAQGRVDHLSLAMDFVFSDERFQPAAFNISVTSALNQWANRIDASDEWELDSLVPTLDQEFQDNSEALEFDSLAFNNRDAEYLQEARWCRALSDRLSADDRFADFRWLFAKQLLEMSDEDKSSFREAPDRLAFLARMAHPTLDEEQAAQLATCLRLFDWIVRNVQLDESLDPPTELEITQFALISGEPGQSPAALGVPGPGYTLFPWQALKFGHGDYLQRARIFLQCCRQQQIDAAMLAIPNEETGDLDPWAASVAIGNELYLFDTELGIPIPVPLSGGVATLAQVASDGSILESLDIEDDDSDSGYRRYPYDATDASTAVALLEAGPQSLSRRMAELENALTGDYRLWLTVNATSLAERIKSCNGVDECKIWNLAYLTVAYRTIFERAVERQSERVMRTYVQKEQVYDIDIGLAMGRHRTILGMLENNEETNDLGAKSIFYDRRFPDEMIDAVQENRDMQVMYGIDVLGELTADERLSQIRDLQTQLRVVRTNAAYWLAISHLETETPATAINWLERVGDYDPGGIWSNGTRFNLARAYETVGRFDEAIDTLEASEGPQRYGNLLRARLLVDYETASQL